MSKKPAVFFDRDGTIIEDRGHLNSLKEICLFPGTIPSLQKLGSKFELFIITHQPGVSRGLITMADVDMINGHIMNVLRKAGIHIRETYVCPHDRSEGCVCIKPQPYHLLQATERYYLDLGCSYTIGDHPHDVELGRNAGLTGIYLLSGHGKKHRNEMGEDTIVVPGISEAISFILEDNDR
ncbi:D-glycero-alpha-D-manno-heptose-1,7-bisphosphate 7-phosphatase [Candidatus Latescibacterota bacterium]